LFVATVNVRLCQLKKLQPRTAILIHARAFSYTARRLKNFLMGRIVCMEELQLAKVSLFFCAVCGLFVVCLWLSAGDSLGLCVFGITTANFAAELSFVLFSRRWPVELWS
jgi:hypothetical protein